MDQYITRFDITMHDIILDQHLERFQQILKIPQSPFLTEIPILLDHTLQSPTITVFIHKIYIVSSFKDLDKFYNMGCVLDFGQGLYFVDSELFQPRAYFILLDFYYFDCYGLISFLIGCFVHLTELPFPDF